MTSTTASSARTVPFARPWITDEDRRAVAAVLDGHVLTHGPEGKQFESEFVDFMGGGHAVSISSCMAALHLAYLHFGIGPGDEVVVPAQTHVATAHAVEWVGATSVFVDCDPLTGNIGADAIRAAITPRTKAITLVHFLGIPCDMRAIVSVADEYGLKVIEDCALAVGSRWEGRHVGLFGDVGCFSFYPVKHLTTAEGGMFVSRHREVVEAVARLRAFGVDRTHAERSLPGMYDVPELGLNYRMSELQAALGRAQLGRIGENLDRRRRNFERLREVLRGLAGIRVVDAQDGRATNSHYCLAIVLEGEVATRRERVVATLAAKGVGSSVYYPQPVPRMSYYRTKYGYDADSFPHATEISDCSIALPVGPHLADEDIDYVAESVRAALTMADVPA